MATYQVNSTGDFVDNDGNTLTLREAILEANENPGADTIDLTLVSSTITITDNILPLIEEDLTIIGDGNDVIDGNGQYRPFFVKSGNVALENLTIQNGLAQGGSGTSGGGGAAGMGGGLFIFDGNVTVTNVTFSGNQAIGGEGTIGSFSNGGGGGGFGGAGGQPYQAYAGGGGGGFGAPGLNASLGGEGNRASGGNGGDGGYYGGAGGSGGYDTPGLPGSGGGGGGGGGYFTSGSEGGAGGFGAGGGGGGALSAGGAGGFGGGGGSGGSDTNLTGGTGGNGGDGGYGGGGGAGGGGEGFGSGGLGGDGGGYGGYGYGGGGAGMGGAIFVRSGSLALNTVSFENNSATGGGATVAGEGSGLGGAIFVMQQTSNSNGNNQGMPATTPTVTAESVSFSGNTAADATDPSQTGTGTDLNTNAAFGSITEIIPLPTVSITAFTDTTEEGSALNGVYVVERSGDTTSDLVVTLTANPSPDLTDDDFTLMTGGDVSGNLASGYTITIPAGQPFINVDLVAADDAIAEADETLELSVAPSAEYSIDGTDSAAAVTISANDFLVTTTADSGEGSLRQAILNANAAAGIQTITFDAGLAGQTILLSHEILITDNVEIQGLGADQITISGGNATRIFNVDDGNNSTKQEVIIDGVTLANGSIGEDNFIVLSTDPVASTSGPPDDGGAIFNAEKIFLRNSVIQNSQASDDGGAIRNDGELTIINSILTGNSATGTTNTSGGGAILTTNAPGTVLNIYNSTISGNTARNGGGIRQDGGILRVYNSTISGNTSTQSAVALTLSDPGIRGGGGIAILTPDVNAEIVNSTITNNATASTGSGSGILSASSVTLGNTIMAGNGSDRDLFDVLVALGLGQAIFSEGNNLIGNGEISAFVDGVNNDQVGTSASPIDPLLGPLQDNGGFTPTHALLAGSPAINAGNNANIPPDLADLDGDSNLSEDVPFDQRVIQERVIAGTVDIGAYEKDNVPPVLDDQTLNVDEGTTAVGTVAVTNADNDSLTYSITAGNEAGVFEIDGATGQISVTAGNALDFETLPNTYTLTVEATEDNPDGLSDTGIVTINVNDVNEAPVVSDRTFDVSENSTFIGTVTAEDAENDSLTYSIVAGNDSGLFSIDSTTGSISVASGNTLDFETLPNSYTLTVRATEDSTQEELFDEGTVTINVTDVNEPPVITGDLAITVLEGNDVALTTTDLDEADEDDDGNGLTYSITTAPTNGLIALSSDLTTAISSFTQTQLEAGVVTYVHDDSETTTDSFTVSLADGGEDGATPASETISVNITPVNDPPSITGDLTIIVAEGDNVAIATEDLSGSDPDDTALSYTITSAPQNGYIALANNPAVPISNFTQSALAAGNVIYVHDGTDTTTDSFTVSLADGGEDGAEPAIATVDVTVTSTNDAPTIALENVDSSVLETQDVTDRVQVATVVITDDEAGTNNLAITGTDADSFELENNVLYLKANTPLDFEAQSQYDIAVTVDDPTLGATIEDQEPFTLQVTNVAPVIAAQSFAVDANAADGVVVGAIATTGDSSSLSYTITSGNDSNAFAINEAGELVVNDSSVLDFDAQSQYSLTVQVSDGTTPASATVTVDLNEVGGDTDFNGDGSADLVWRNYATGENAIWYLDNLTAAGGGPIGGENPIVVANQNWVIEGVGDFDGDGEDDLVWRNYNSGENVIWFMDGTTPTRSQFFLQVPDTTWRIQGVGDFDNDGLQDDLVWRNYASGDQIIWFTEDGTPQSSAAIPLSITDFNWQIVGVGDFDDDNQQDDLVWRNDASGDQVIWFMDGSTPLSSAVISINLPDPSWRIEGVTDLDGDMTPDDLLWRNYSSGDTVAWYLNGANVVDGGAFSPTVSGTNWVVTV